MIQDLKLGVRLLARRPGFTAVAVASLALGVGLNTTLFSVVNAVLLRNTPAEAPDRLVEIYSSLHEEYPYLTTSYPDYLAIRDNVDALSGVAAHAFVRRSWETVHPWGSGGVFPAFPDRDLPQPAEAYHGSNLPRLRTIMSRYDPTNVFQFLAR